MASTQRNRVPHPPPLVTRSRFRIRYALASSRRAWATTIRAVAFRTSVQPPREAAPLLERPGSQAQRAWARRRRRRAKRRHLSQAEIDHGEEAGNVGGKWAIFPLPPSSLSPLSPLSTLLRIPFDFGFFFGVSRPGRRPFVRFPKRARRLVDIAGLSRKAKKGQEASSRVQGREATWFRSGVTGSFDADEGDRLRTWAAFND